MTKTTKIILTTIVFLGFAVRIFNVANLPQILNRDEAALAYNGLLLSQTGQDECGKRWPLTLESFGDYKLPGYSYTLAGVFKILPTEDWVVRLPSVLAGTLLILVSFYFAKNFFTQDKYALLFSFIIATTPVFFFYSRIAFEANVALVLTVGALTLIFKKSPTTRTDLLSAGLILLSVLFYNTPLLLLPFIILSLPLLRGLKKSTRWLPLALGLSAIFVVMFWQLASVSAQKSGITIFGDDTTWHKSVAYRQQFSGVWQSVLGNQYLFYARIMFKNYLASISKQFLVDRGGSHPWHTLPGDGHLFLSIYLLGIFGVIISLGKIIKNRGRGQRSLLVLLWLMVTSLIPAVITTDAPHATRSLLFFYLFSFAAILGFIKLKHLTKLKHLMFVFGLLIIFDATFYLRHYFNIYPKMQPDSLRVGFGQTIQKVEQKYPEKTVAIVADEYQYILLAWYLKIPPTQFLATIHKQNPNRIGLKYGDYLTHYHLIADSRDRVSSETILVEWRGGVWQVTEF